MRLISYDDTVNRPLPFFLAMEEHFARNRQDEFFFMWQVDPTVIIGRHQLLEAEIDTSFCAGHDINIVRRKSGGGAVFADRNNIMFSYITRPGNVADCMREYTGRVASMLSELGLDARTSDRNDVLIGDRKVSGYAFYNIGSRNIVHGTMLYDCDPAMMGGALTPSASKLRSKGVASVRSRVTTLREHLPSLTLNGFKTFAASMMSDGEDYRLTDQDITEINRLAEVYSSPDWLTGKNPEGKAVRSGHIAGVGEITVAVATRRGKISSVELTGDFFAGQDFAALGNLLSGVDYTPRAVAEALAGTDVGQLVHGLTDKQLIDLLF